MTEGVMMGELSMAVEVAIVAVKYAAEEATGAMESEKVMRSKNVPSISEQSASASDGAISYACREVNA